MNKIEATDKKEFGSLLKKAIERLARQVDSTVERYQEEVLASKIDRAPTTINKWKRKNSTRLFDSKPLMGLVWLILTDGKEDLEWLTKFLATTDLDVPRQWSYEMLNQYLKWAEIDKRPIPEIERDKVIRRLLDQAYPSNLEHSATSSISLSAKSPPATRDFIIEEEFQGIHWAVANFSFLTPKQKEFAQIGIDFFVTTLSEGKSIEEIVQSERFKDLNSLHLYDAFKYAIVNGLFRLLKVPRNELLEAELQRKYGLKQVVVAKTPNTVPSLIAAEFVAFLAAHETVKDLKRQRSIGMGSGYTMWRFANYCLLYREELRGCKWIPLFTYRLNERYSANEITAFMASHDSFSERLHLPYIHKSSSPLEKEQHSDVVSECRQATAIFYSVNGFDRPRIPDEIRTTDGLQTGNLYKIIEKLEQEGITKADIAGAILANLVSNEGDQLGSSKVTKIYAELVTQIDLSILQQVGISQGVLGIVAAKQYKARAVQAAIRNGFANSLVIDSEIADYLNGT